MKCLEESKVKVKEAIVAFCDKAGEALEKVSKKLAETLDSDHKNVTESVPEILDMAKEAEKFTDDDRKNISFCMKCFKYYYVRSNIELALNILKLGATRGADCTTLGSFIASLPQPERGDISKQIRETLIKCK